LKRSAEGEVTSGQILIDMKDIQWHRKIFVPNAIVYQEQLQEQHAISTPISYFKKYFTS
jgi:hypothetical protein